MEAYFKEYDFDDCGFCKNCYVDKTYKCKKGIYIDFVVVFPSESYIEDLVSEEE